MNPPQQPQLGLTLITLMAALVLVLQIAMVAQRWIVTNIRIFGLQSVVLGVIAAMIAYVNHAPHLYAAAALTFIVKGLFLPVWLERLVANIGIRREVEPLINVPSSILISGVLTIVAYVVSQSFYTTVPGAAGVGSHILPVALSLFLIGFFTMINRKKALTQVLGLLSLENGIFLAAVSLTYGVPLIVELGVFFDVLVGVMVLGILVYRIRESIDSMDVSKLSRLKG
jgi:hydrogenase-4 component E